MFYRFFRFDNNSLYLTLVLPDTAANLKRNNTKTYVYQIYNNMTLPAYPKWIPKRQILTFNDWLK